MEKHKIYSMSVSSVYPHYVKKAKNGQMEAKALSSVPLLMKSDRTPTCRKKCVRLFAVKQ